jgi:phenylpyruvate tautomerase PptA (4-oxalocrotonate tautomerase family)
MPHVIVKMYAGRAEPEKKALAEEITRAVSKTLGYGDDAVSVSIEMWHRRIGPKKSIGPTSWTSRSSSTKSPATTLSRPDIRLMIEPCRLSPAQAGEEKRVPSSNQMSAQ